MTNDTTELRNIYRRLNSITECTPIATSRAIGVSVLEIVDTWDFVNENILNSCLDLASVRDDEDIEVIMSSVSVLVFSICHLIVSMEEDCNDE